MAEEKKDAKKPENVTMTLEQLEQLVDRRVKAALKQQAPRHAKSPAPKLQVFAGRYASSGGIIESLAPDFFERVKKLDPEKRELQLEQLRQHRRAIPQMDPAGLKLDRFFAECEQLEG